MRRPARSSSWRLWAAISCAIALIAIFRPWTVQPITHDSARTFDAATYVDSIWTTKVLPQAASAAIDIVSFAHEARPSVQADGAAPASIFVKGTGLVTDVDLTSRVGVAHVVFGERASGVRAGVQIGPVLRGTALRDALPFISFSDFVNQLDYASVASELNARALQTALAGLDPRTLKGRTLSLTGAVPAGGSDPGTWQIVPVILVVEGRAS